VSAAAAAVPGADGVGWRAAVGGEADSVEEGAEDETAGLRWAMLLLF
jgi:hypothetical protein